MKPKEVMTQNQTILEAALMKYDIETNQLLTQLSHKLLKQLEFSSHTSQKSTNTFIPESSALSNYEDKHQNSQIQQE